MPTLALSDIAPAIKDGQYNLLLGAGISMDSKNAAGDHLPGGDGLRNELGKLVGARPGSSLQRVYSALTDDQKRRHVIDRYRGCTAGRSLNLLPTFLWRRIFTFNIDDVLEDVYRNKNSLQQAITYNYTDPYVESVDLSSVPLIHLHGWVRRPADGLVFSHSEYARQMQGINPWMTVLSQYIPGEPFIIAGTALEEVDLEYYLAGRTPQTVRGDRPPSVWIVPEPDAITRDECERHGMVLFEGTFERFLSELDQVVPTRVPAVELLDESIRDLFPVDFPKRDLLAFSTDFELVPAHIDGRSRGERFLFGLQPSWRDLASGVDVGRRVTRIIMREVMLRVSDATRQPRILSVLDGVGTGKTTVLRRIAFDLAASGKASVIANTPLSRLEPFTIAKGLNAIDGPVVVLIDNLAEHVYALAQIIPMLKKEDIVFLCGEREYRKQYIQQALAGFEWREVGRLRLDDSEARQLIEVYRDAGLLARRDATEKPFRDALVSEPIAVASCRILDDFRPLNRIIDSVLAEASERDRDRYLVAAIAYYCFRGGVRYDVLASICGTEGVRGQIDRPHPLPLAFVNPADRNFVIPLNGTISAQVLSRSEPPALLPHFIALGNAIASRVNRPAIKQRSPEARLANRLFDYDEVVERFLRDKAIEFYDGVRSAWQWTSRYWEQVALLNVAKFYAGPESADGLASLDLAIQHARHAVAIEHHHFTLTTLGKVLLASVTVSHEGRRRLYDEAFQRLTEAIRIEQDLGRSSPQAYVSLFRGTREYLARGEGVSEYQAQVLEGLLRDAEARLRADDDLQREVYELRGALLT
jgi:hypothetical protein